jgi:transcriptional regulator with GAF, ATPase, and Fis domain
MAAPIMKVRPSDDVTLDPARALQDEAALGSAARLRALYELGRLLQEEDEPARLLAAIHETVVRQLGAEHACLLEVAGDGGLRPVATRGLDLNGAPEDWPVSGTALRRVRETGLALLASDVSEDPELGGAGSIRRLRVRSVLCAPLGRGRVRGLLYLDNRGDGRGFDRDDLEFLTAVSAYASPLLERAEQHQRTAADLQRSQEQVALLEEELLRHHIVGRSPKLLAAYDALRRFARAYAAHSPRAGRAYVPVPIPALAPGLVESELFGHVRGAFTEASRDKRGRLELADGGVLFLDEVGDIEPALQAKLLRFLDSGELVRVGDTEQRRVDVLLVSATNRPVEKMAAEGRFRDDLLARLGQELVLPPLRERPEDVPLLVEHFLERHGRGGVRQTFAAETIEVLQGYRWELNVRQLQQVVERAVCLVDDAVVRPEHLPPFILESAGSAGAAAGALTVPARDLAGRPRPLKDVVLEVEKEHILRTLEQVGGSRRQAMAALQLSPEKFYKRLEELGLHKKGR